MCDRAFVNGVTAANKRRIQGSYSKRKLFPLTLFVLLCIGLSGVSYIEQASAAASITLSLTSGAPGSTVTVTGSGFAKNTVTSILFDFAFVEETTTNNSGAFTKSITIPTTANGGSHKITANDGVSSVDATFTVSSQTLIALTPTSGAIGTTVTVSGSNFGASKTITIRFDNDNVLTSPFSVVSTNTGAFSATFKIPSAALVGSHTVSAMDGTLTSTGIFNVSGLSLVSISPTSGAAGIALTVTGSGFSPNSVVTVKFDSTALVTSPATITTTSSGTFSGTVTIPTGIVSGSHTLSAADNSGRSGSAIFNITTSGTITLSSNSGISGNTITISGSGYSPRSTISMRFDSGTIVTSPPTVITTESGSFSAAISIPGNAAIGTHTIAATDSSGRTASSVFSVTTTALISISPTTGLTGTEVTVTGSNFAANSKTAIKFGNISVRTFPLEVVTSSSGTFLAKFDVPAGVTGSHSVIANDNTGRAGIASFAVTAPLVSLSPVSATISSGTPVTVSGSGFAPNSEVTILFDGNIVGTNPSRITTTTTGTFTATFAVPATASLGGHTIRVESNGDSGIASFNIVGRVSAITLSSTGVASGSPITVSGSGFIPNTSITVKFDNSILATTMSSSSGSFLVAINMPINMAPGSHIVSASDGINSASSTVMARVRGEDILSVSDLKLLDSRGLTVSSPSEGSQVMIQSKLRNNLSVDQDFAYIVQIKDSEDVTVMISWITGTLPADKEFAVAVSWLVEAEGRYNAQVFTWDSITDPDVLAPSLRMTIRV